MSGTAGAPSPPGVLVTGAAGFVGSRLLERLAAQPETFGPVTGLDVRPPGRTGDGIGWITADIRDEALDTRLRDHPFDVVVHLAAIVTPSPGMNADTVRDIDVRGTERVLELCSRRGVRQLVVMSSGAAYGYHPDNPVPLRENHPLRGNEGFPYSRDKRIVEELLARHREAHPELRQLVFRSGTILGPGVRNPISAMFARPVVIGIAGSDIPFVLIWIDDVLGAIEHGVRNDCVGIYNLAADGTISLREMARRLGKPYLPVPARLLALAIRVGRLFGFTDLAPEQVSFLRHRPVLDNTRLKEDLGYVPAITSEEVFDHYVEFLAR